MTKEKPAALFLRWILHDWNDHECVKILDALRAGVDKGTKSEYSFVLSDIGSDSSC